MSTEFYGLEWSEEKAVSFTYTNHAGQTSTRAVLPLSIFFGKCKWHPDEQWLLLAYDTGRSALRTFALSKVSDWKPVG